MSEISELTQKISETLAKGGSYCFSCNIFFDTVVEARKHDFEKHYEYALAQCHGDVNELKKWMALKQ